jgi:regulator of protease activity HflC (stomatin/prohibitin superfamily)
MMLDYLFDPFYNIFLVVPIFIILLFFSLRIVPDNHCVIVERCSKYHRTVQPGWHIVVPILESIKEIRWTWYVEVNKGETKGQWKEVTFAMVRKGEATYDFPPVVAQTLDRLPVTVNGLVYYSITDPKKMAYSVDAAQSLSRWLEGAMRHAVAQHKYDDLVSNAGVLQNDIIKAFNAHGAPDEKGDKEATNLWGMSLEHLVIQSIDLPPTLQSNLNDLRKQRDSVASKREIAEMECKLREFDLKSKIDLQMQEQKHELELARRRTEWETQRYKMFIDAGMTHDYLLRQRELDTLKAHSGKVIIVPRDFRALLDIET